MNFDNLIAAVIYLVCCYFLFWIGKLAYDQIHRDINVNAELVQSMIIVPSHSLWLVTILV